MADYTEKTLEPTPHRRRLARQEGQVVKSLELCSAAVLLAGFAALTIWGESLAAFLLDFCREQLSGRAWLSADGDWTPVAWDTLRQGLLSRLGPILLLFCLGGVAANILQGGLLFLPQRLLPNPERINPVRAMQRIFSSANLIRFLLGACMLMAVAAITIRAIYRGQATIGSLAALEPAALLNQAAKFIAHTALQVAGVLLLGGLADYAFQYWRHERQLRMTPQEMREELKHLEGDAHLLNRRKQLRRASSRKAMHEHRRETSSAVEPVAASALLKH